MIHEGGKIPYPTKIMAERAAELRMLQNPSLELNVYQASDGKWYLTRQNPDTR